jgi:putative nucleotidyltransferase with HDIG domain
MSVRKIKEFLLRADLEEVLPSEIENEEVSPFSEQEKLIETYNQQMLKYVQDFKKLFENEKKARIELEKTYFETITALAKTVERRDSYTGGHADRVTLYATLTAEELGLDYQSKEDVKLAALLHDIGKISVPDAILSKGSRLTAQEFEIMKTHPQNGIEIIKNIHSLENLIPAILSHHEAFDGKGYPYGLSREEIPCGGRIIAVVDTFDAITSSRSYRKGSSFEKGVEEINRCSGTQFDPEVVQAFIRVFESGQFKNYAPY